MRFPFVLLTTLLLAPLVAICAEAGTERQAADLQKAFIWSPSALTGKQVYAVFRKTFPLKQRPAPAVMQVFADSRYLLWINGKYVNQGPCRFDPRGPEYDALDVARYLQPGRNTLAIAVHHFHDGEPVGNGAQFCGRIMRHAPGLTATLETIEGTEKRIVQTDGTWRVSAHNRFGPSPGSWTSIIDHVDARRDRGDWTAADFDDAAWETAVAIDGKQWGPLHARRIPLLRESEVRPLRLIQRQANDKAPENLADKPELQTTLPIELSAGDQIVIDAGRFVQAYWAIDMEADASSQLALSYAQAFFSSGNKPAGMCCDGSHYTARQGRQTFMTSDTFGCKYVAVRCTAGKVRLLGVRLVNRLYPFDETGKFRSTDPLLNNIWQLGVNTIQTCSEDAYVDCAVRERTEWLADAVMVAYPISRATMAGPGADGKATLNAYLVRALSDAAELARHLGDSGRQREYAEASRALQAALNAQLWDEKTGLYHGAILDGAKTPFTVHAAAMCLYYDIVPAERRKPLEQWFLANIEKEGCCPFQYAFYFEVLARIDSDEADRRALDLIRRRWKAMSEFETQTTFEGFGPGENCHEAGGTPTIYLSRHVLGVDVAGPAADRRLTVKPHLGDLQRAEGVVATEFGLVSVCWDRLKEDGRLTFDLQIPVGVTARVHVPRLSAKADLVIDGGSVQPVERTDRYIIVELGAGRHHGVL